MSKDVTYFGVSYILEKVDSISNNICRNTPKYEKNKKKLNKMKDLYKNDAEKFAEKYLIERLEELDE